MEKFIRVSVVGTVVLLLLNMVGCATYTTLSEAKPGDPRVFSGTRLNIRAIKDENDSVGDLKLEPAANPALDLPFSLVMDIMLLPYTLSYVAYDKLFHY